MNSNYHHRVILVVDRSYGDNLGLLPSRVPIWVVDSESNRPAIRGLWQLRKNSTHLGEVTSFNDEPELSPEDLAVSMLDTIELHHGVISLQVLEIVGARMSDALVEALHRIRFLFATRNRGDRLEFRRYPDVSERDLPHP